MHRPTKVQIREIGTGIPGLDEVLGGGIPEYSLNLIAGAPGTGKTTLSQQIMFANASRDRPALHFTVLGEPPVKLLRYQQRFEFFDLDRVGSEIHLLNLIEEVLHSNFDVILERITNEVERLNPSVVVVDSFRTLLRSTEAASTAETELQRFVQRLALRLTSWEATTFLIGEYTEMEARNPIFTVADGLLWMSNEVDRNASVRKLRVTKLRGQEALAGLHTFRISTRGIEVFPRLPKVTPVKRPPEPLRRLTTGIAGLDEMMHGGIPSGDSVLVAGPTGSGKTILATHFIAEGVRVGEKAVLAVFEENPEAYVERAKRLGFELDEMQSNGQLEIMYLRPLDLTVDETLQELRSRVIRLDASRVVIDSLSGFEIALAAPFRDDFRDSLCRLIGALTALSVSVLSTVELADTALSLQFAPNNVFFLTDDIIAQRFVELDGQLRKVVSVVKMRGSDHSRDLRAYEITSKGIVVGDMLSSYRGIITGVPARVDGDWQPPLPPPSIGGMPT